MDWTAEQKKAIDSRDGTILVSAAAGSGKTAVLVERIIQRLLDDKKPCDADKLLIVTFTKAATAQMKEKIEAAISKRLAQDPNDRRLLHQQMLLPFAKICTVDSFCNWLVRENFHLLDIDPDFKILDKSELTVIRDEAISNVVESLYCENSLEFTELVELLYKGKGDSELTKTIVGLYNFSTAYPFPEEWLKQIGDSFDGYDEHDFRIKIVLDYLKDAVGYCLDCATETLKYIEQDEAIYNSYSSAFLSDISKLKALTETVCDGNWDEIRYSVSSLEFEKLKPAPKGYDGPYKDLAQDRRKAYKGIIKTEIPEIMCSSIEEYREDLQFFAPLVRKLIEAVGLFGEEFSRLKAKSNGFDFSDINHLALKLLVEKKPDGSIAKTELAKSVSLKFEEILVDEFQDINEAQNMLFSAVSKDESNLFMVGDVKQSIYRFRQAMPEIFLRRRDSMPEYADGNYPASIYLDKNFRSRGGIIDAVNYIFSQLMSRKIGEVDYLGGERLAAGAVYSERVAADAEIHVLEYNADSENGKENEQACYIAGLINKMISDGLTVKDGGSERPAAYRDFCILMRSTKNHAQAYVEELTKQNIPAYCGDSNGFFNVPEVNFILSLLRVLDNPMQDVPLISVMLSPIFGFTADNLAQLRIDGPKAAIYSCLLNAGKNGDKKCADFLAELERLRMFSYALSTSALVRMLLEETGYYAIVGAMPNGEQRRANLRLFEDYAERYSNFGSNSVSGFIRFIDKISAGGEDLSQANQISEAANVVRIMTMHSSKGLEFPVCILANCQSEFNLNDIKNNYVVHSTAGIGFNRRDLSTFRQFDTLTHRAVSLALKKSQKSEELRVLYVAMTRAKERLIAVMSIKNVNNTLKSYAKNLSASEQINPFAVFECKSFAEWILTAAMRHPDSHVLREMAGIDSSYNLKADFRLKTVISTLNEYFEEEIIEEDEAESNDELLKIIENNLSYKYKYASLGEVTAKRAASQIKDNGINREFFAASRPAFLNSEGLTPAQKGTATHKYMQYADYLMAKADSGSECKRLVEKGYLSEQEGKSVALSKIDIFFSGTLAQRIFESKNVMREKKFTINLPVGELYENLKDFDDEYVLIQGIADCVFVENNELIIVDYKTDYAASETKLAERYREQLNIYRRALTQCLDMPVRH